MIWLVRSYELFGTRQKETFQKTESMFAPNSAAASVSFSWLSSPDKLLLDEQSDGYNQKDVYMCNSRVLDVELLPSFLPL